MYEWGGRVGGGGGVFVFYKQKTENEIWYGLVGWEMCIRDRGAMPHPLNHPRFDPDTRRVVEGYGVLHPRGTPPLPGLAGAYMLTSLPGEPVFLTRKCVGRATASGGDNSQVVSEEVTETTASTSAESLAVDPQAATPAESGKARARAR